MLLSVATTLRSLVASHRGVASGSIKWDPLTLTSGSLVTHWHERVPRVLISPEAGFQNPNGIQETMDKFSDTALKTGQSNRYRNRSRVDFIKDGRP